MIQDEKWYDVYNNDFHIVVNKHGHFSPYSVSQKDACWFVAADKWTFSVPPTLDGEKITNLSPNLQ